MPTEPFSPDRPWRQRASFAAMLALAMGTGTYVGYAFGVLGPGLRAEFAISRTQLGLLTTTLFVVGGPLSLVAGHAAARLGARRVMFAAFAITAAAVLIMATSRAYLLLLAGAALAGVALATGNPVTNKLIAVHVPRGARGLTMGTKQAGVQVGAFLVGIAMAPLAAGVGWRAALGWSALVPVIGMVGAWFLIPPDLPHEVPHPPSQPSRPPPAHGRDHPGIRWLLGYAFLMGSGVAAINAYLPLYLVERTQVTPAVAGAVAATIGLVGIGSRIAWAWLSERLHSFTTPLLLLGIGSVLSILLVLAVEVAGIWIAWPAAALFGATAITWNAVGMLAVITVSGSGLAGRASGVVTFGFYIGFVASPIVFGLIVDHLGGYLPAWSLVALAFAATVPIVLARRRAERAAVRVSRR